jgi:hypothetical protein
MERMNEMAAIVVAAKLVIKHRQSWTLAKMTKIPQYFHHQRYGNLTN